MSEAIIRSVPPIALPAEAGLLGRINRLALAWSSRIERMCERRRERLLLGAMSDRELADIGVGPGQADRAFREGRG
ncbi:DUF1127 domain-containing protein [Enterovirga rhinocerotis]|uniref:Uncharacterized protein DUF1127 n=1 Tax=Enterovirga rhinocerotis TaxID=1339210 RepID=A0A4R7BW47_9HYPH|nr:DUF1127 domain-containing protein [Enterovirga rhinocerotis]TDR90108.1 uncharacterized protein DUF1127 [Enterovirga rhinocerotis]